MNFYQKIPIFVKKSDHLIMKFYQKTPIFVKKCDDLIIDFFQKCQVLLQIEFGILHAQSAGEYFSAYPGAKRRKSF